MFEECHCLLFFPFACLILCHSSINDSNQMMIKVCYLQMSFCIQHMIQTELYKNYAMRNSNVKHN
jgi:hypothetical protein